MLFAPLRVLPFNIDSEKVSDGVRVEFNIELLQEATARMGIVSCSPLCEKALTSRHNGRHKGIPTAGGSVNVLCVVGSPSFCIPRAPRCRRLVVKFRDDFNGF
jgi:hypothetical protein